MLENLRHPSIVMYLGAHESSQLGEKKLYIALEYMGGGSLEAIIADGPLHYAVVRRYMWHQVQVFSLSDYTLGFHILVLSKCVFRWIVAE